MVSTERNCVISFVYITNLSKSENVVSAERICWCHVHLAEAKLVWQNVQNQINSPLVIIFINHINFYAHITVKISGWSLVSCALILLCDVLAQLGIFDNTIQSDHINDISPFQMSVQIFCFMQFFRWHRFRILFYYYDCIFFVFYLCSGKLWANDIER